MKVLYFSDSENMETPWQNSRLNSVRQALLGHRSESTWRIGIVIELEVFPSDACAVRVLVDIQPFRNNTNASEK